VVRGIAGGVVLIAAGSVWINRSHLLPGSLHLLTILCGIAVLVVLTLWLLPIWQVSRSKGLTAANRFDRENEARKTLAQIIGGVFVLAGLYSSVKTFDLQRQTENLQEQGQITDRFTKAIDQLGAVAPGGVLDQDGKPRINLEARLGGIYALERIARDSPRDDWTIMEVLTAYVRENAPIRNQPRESRAKSEDPAKLRADVQAALTAIGRRNAAYDPAGSFLNLHDTSLQFADLRDANLRRVNLYLTNLHGASLERAELSGAELLKADLSGAYLTNANLTGATLSGADLSGANLNGAFLGGANLGTAIVGDATVLGPNLSGANLSDAKGLTDQALRYAYGDSNTKLPLGIHRLTDWKEYAKHDLEELEELRHSENSQP
jgi:hypothetical protein